MNIFKNNLCFYIISTCLVYHVSLCPSQCSLSGIYLKISQFFSGHLVHHLFYLQIIFGFFFSHIHFCFLSFILIISFSILHLFLPYDNVQAIILYLHTFYAFVDNHFFLFHHYVFLIFCQIILNQYFFQNFYHFCDAFYFFCFSSFPF